MASTVLFFFSVRIPVTPPTTNPAALEDKLARAARRAWVDHAFFVGAAADNVESLAALERQPGCLLIGFQGLLPFGLAKVKVT